MALFSWRPRQTARWTHVPAQRRTAEQHARAVWRESADRLGLARLVHTVSGPTVSVPRVGGVRVDPEGGVQRMTVQRQPGQVTADYRAVCSGIADAFGAAHVAVEDLADRWVALTFSTRDPLARPHPWRPALPPGFLAVTETGARMACPWEDRPHTVVQGQTGSGKSHFTYGQVAALASRPAVQVAGIDPSGLVFRPWPDDPWRVSGLGGDLIEHRRALRALVAEMDRRLVALPDDVDDLAPGSAVPLVVVVLEEYAALIRAAELAGKPVVAELRGLVARLLAEGRKVAFRVLLVVQRADASVVDGLVRAQCGLRVSFASEADGLAMLHPRGAVDADQHAVADPGVAVLTAPGVGTIRVRTARLPYAEYVAAVRSTCR